jgi:hypothetical protein
VATSELEKRPAQTVDTRDEPSADWGWHQHFPRMRQVAGWITVIVLLLMNIGNHQGHVEDLWLIGIAVVIAGALVHDLVKRRTPWRS